MRLHIALFALVLPTLALAEWSGNMAVNPGFEEDFVNPDGEGAVLAFKGDWYYGQTDGVPDYWALKAGWEWRTDKPHGGGHYLRLADKAAASRDFAVAVTHSGGGAWGGTHVAVPPCARPEQFPRSVRASVMCRKGGQIKLTCGGVSKTAGLPPVGDAAWHKVQVEIPAAEQKPGSYQSMKVELIGPGDFDDVVLQEELDGSPNLLPNASFEALTDGFPTGWSKQRKYTWMGPTYYIWTDWYHFHQPNRGEVALDTLITRSGRNALRFDVLPGDEKLVEGPEVVLNQDAPRLIEISAMVRADRIMLIDLRAADQDGVDLPCARPRHPEPKATPGQRTTTASALYGNGTFGWRYVRKVFAPRGNQPLKSVRVRLCARGFNGCTLDDGGTRHYCLQAGTVWWDDVRVVERASTAAQLKARGVKFPAVKTAQLAPAPVRITEIDFGERLVGRSNTVTLTLETKAKVSVWFANCYVMPGVVSMNETETSERGSGRMVFPYDVHQPVGDFERPGTLKVEALRGGKVVGATRISYYTWPKVADFDFESHLTYPNENPVVCTVNLGVTKAMLNRTKTIELILTRVRDDSQISKQVIKDVKGALREGAAGKWKDGCLAGAYSIHVADHTNLIALSLNLSKLKVWPQDEPTLDTYVHLRALDKSGKLLFEAKSQRIGRVQAFDRNRMQLAKTVEVRKEDGAVLVNGEPAFLTGGTHQNARLSHGPKELALYGFRGYRLTGGSPKGGYDLMWPKYKLWELQTKPVAGAGTTAIHTQLTEQQFAELKKVVDAGKHLNVISYNTGGWEACLSDKSKWPAHYASNDRIRKMTGRPIAISTSGAYNAWEFSEYFPWYDINHAETEMWGPMDFNTIYTPHMKRRAPAGRRSTWVYLPQLYDNHPYARLRFETYENIIRGSAGYSMIQGIGDPTFNRAMCGELRYLEKPLYSLDKAPGVKLSPDVSHKATRYKDKLYVLATNAGPIRIGAWTWNEGEKFSGRASHDGDSRNAAWPNPNGWHLHGYRGDPCGGNVPVIQAGDKIVQYVRVDPKDKPDCIAFGIRGDGMFAHNVTLGKFTFAQFTGDASNVFFYTELNHSTWHHVGSYFDKEKEALARKIMGEKYAANVRASSDKQHKWVTDNIYKPGHFVSLGALPTPGEWRKIEVPAEKIGLVGKLVDGFFFAAKGGRALWDHTALVRGGKEIAVFCEDSMGVPPAELAEVTIAVPGVADGTQVKVLFEERTLTVKGGKFTDSFVGTDAYGREWGGVEGDNYAYMPGRGQHDFRELVTLLPSGYGYDYNDGKACVHVYEIPLK